MRIQVDKCEQCGATFQDEVKYADHMKTHELLTMFDGAFPKVEDDSCRFVNGGWNVQRDQDWLERYTDRIVECIGDLGHKIKSYAWFRTLDDGGHVFYGRACRILNICPKCYREWGQQYYANNCNCIDKPKP